MEGRKQHILCDWTRREARKERPRHVCPLNPWRGRKVTAILQVMRRYQFLQRAISRNKPNNRLFKAALNSQCEIRDCAGAHPRIEYDAGIMSRPNHQVLSFILAFFLCILCFFSLPGSLWADNPKVTGPHMPIDRVAVLVNDMVIVYSELARDLRWLQHVEPQRFVKTTIPELIDELIEEKIERILIMQEIVKSQFVIIPKPEVDKRYADWQQKLESRGLNLEELLQKIDFSREEFSLQLWTELMIEKYLQQKFRSQVRISDDSLLSWIRQHPAEAGITAEEFEDLDLLQRQQLQVTIRKRLVDVEIIHMYKKRVEELKKTAIIKRMWPEDQVARDKPVDETGPENKNIITSDTE